MKVVTMPEILNEILEEVRGAKAIQARALAEQARGRHAEMKAMASSSAPTGTNQLFKEAADHYQKEADYWDKLAKED